MFRQEGGDPLLGVHHAQQCHQPVFPHDLAAHEARYDLLQAPIGGDQLRQVRIGDRADLRVFQCNGAARMLAARHAVQPHHLPRHLEAGDLLATIRKDLVQ